MAGSSRQKRVTSRVMHTCQELYNKAKRRNVEGRSKMTKRQLENALGLS